MRRVAAVTVGCDNSFQPGGGCEEPPPSPRVAADGLDPLLRRPHHLLAQPPRTPLRATAWPRQGVSPLLCSPLCSPLCGPLCSPSADRSAAPQRSHVLPIVCAYRTRPAQALHTQCTPCTRPPSHPPTPPRSWFLVLPAVVGFAAVLLLLLYSACLVETVDDEALLGLLTILPTYYPLWRYILSMAVHTMAMYLL